MSDQSSGEGWWQASDGKWYPPPRPVDPQTPAEIPPTQPVTPQPAFGPPTGAPPFGPPTGPFAESPAVAPSRSGPGKGTIIGIAAGVLVLLAGIVFFVTRDDGSTKDASAITSDQTDRSDSSDLSDASDSTSSSRSSRSSSSPSGSAVDVPAGFKQLTDTGQGVSIAVPEDFVELDPAALANSSDQSELAGQNPDLAPFLSSGNALLKGAVLAADGRAGGAPVFVVVAKSPQTVDPTDPSVTKDLERGVALAGGTNVDGSTVSLPAGDALRIVTSLEINAGATTGTVNETLYFVDGGSATWLIVGVSVGSNPNTALFDQMAQTFRTSA